MKKTTWLIIAGVSWAIFSIFFSVFLNSFIAHNNSYLQLSPEGIGGLSFITAFILVAGGLFATIGESGGFD